MNESNSNEMIPKKQGNIVSMGRSLPPGVWDNPTPDELQALSELSYVWNKEDLSTTDVPDDVTLRALWYHQTCWGELAYCTGYSVETDAVCDRIPNSTPTGTTYTWSGTDATGSYVLCCDQPYTTQPYPGTFDQITYRGCRCGAPSTHAPVGGGFGHDNSYLWVPPHYPDPEEIPPEPWNDPYNCGESCCGVGSMTFGTWTGTEPPSNAIITSAILRFSGAYELDTYPYEPIVVDGAIHAVTAGVGGVSAYWQSFSVTTESPGNGDPTIATVDIKCLIQELVDRKYLERGGSVTLKFTGGSYSLFQFMPADEFGDPYPQVASLDITYVVPDDSSGTGTAYGTLVTGTISAVGGSYSGTASGYTRGNNNVVVWPSPNFPDLGYNPAPPPTGTLVFGTMWSGGSGAISAFMLFDINIPRDAIVNKATLKLGGYQQDYKSQVWDIIHDGTTESSVQYLYNVGQPVTAIITAQKSTSPVPVTSSADIISRPRTGNQQRWCVEDYWVSGTPLSPIRNVGYKESVDISPVIQEVINQPGWSSGNHKIMVFVDGVDRSLPPGGNIVGYWEGFGGTCNMYDIWQDGLFRAAYGPGMTVLYPPQLQVYYTMGPANETMSGGVKIGGAARFSVVRTGIMSGGVKLDGSARIAVSIPMQGGILADGAADVYVRYRHVSTCSVLVDGTIYGDTVVIASAGVLAADSATIEVQYNLTSTARVLVNGSVFTYNEIMQGGLLVDGASDTHSEVITDIQGGIIVGGSSYTTWEYMSGGILLDGSSDTEVLIVSTCRVVVGGRSDVDVVYEVESQGGVLIAGDSPNDHSYHMQGGVLAAGDADVFWSFEMRGGVVLAGQFEHQIEIIQAVGLGSVVLDGAARVVSMRYFRHVATGGIIIDGSPSYGITSAHYNPTGGVIVEDSLDPTIAGFSVNIDLSLLWRIDATIARTLTLKWGIGKAEMFWYRIIGRGRPGDTCDMKADPCCQKFIMNIHAHTPAELCEKLSKRKWTLPIESVQRFSRPAALGNAFDDWTTQQEYLDEYEAQNGTCDELTPIEICKIAACAEFCIDEDVVVSATLDAFIEMPYSYEAGDGVDEDRSVYICSSPSCGATTSFTRNIPNFSYEASGGVLVEGDSICWTSGSSGGGGIFLDGEAYTECTRWIYVGGESGSIETGGTSGIACSDYTVIGSGSLVVENSTALVKVSRRYRPTGLGYPTTAIVISGTHGLSRGYFASGGVTVEEGSADTRASNYDFVSIVSTLAGGEALVKPYWETMQGGVLLRGSGAQSRKYTGSGSIDLSGRAILTFREMPHGGMFVSGSGEIVTSNWSWEPLDSRVYIDGTAGQKPGTYELDPVVAEFDILVSQMVAVFAAEEQPETISEITATTAQCGCTQIPPIITVSHNLATSNTFSQFLARNNLTMDSAVEMRYNATNASWQANYHYRGLAANANNEERWDVVFELLCTDVMGAVNLGRQIWKLVIEVVRNNLSTYESVVSSVILGLLPETICDINANELEFQVLLDTQETTAIVYPSTTVYQVTLYDNIGLFKNVYWINDPDLVLSVSQSGARASPQRVDLTDLVYV